MTAPKQLIVNADDLGRTEGINEGVFDAHRRGIVTSASLMVNYPAAGRVPALSRDSPALGIGLHVALTGGVPALPPEQVKSLVDADGRLPARPDGLGGADPAEVLAEARAQLKRFRHVMGRDPTHFDSHHHSHRDVPAVFAAILTLAWETGLPVRCADPTMAERLRREGVPTPDNFIDEFYDEGATLADLVRILEGLPPGTTELMCHPAVVDEELRSTSSYADPRARELDALTQAAARQALQRSGIRLVSFGQL
ncbi:MAG: chitooligosaccharide deacetylase [Acidobacteria bacterium]|nr:MAG: chitooligosaccharide deacetylase [Acidobacteriota bacterium]PYQ24913.1 MAG: chitooligosaccharide deacetylase [Acidobacteriota bacterium]